MQASLKSCFNKMGISLGVPIWSYKEKRKGLKGRKMARRSGYMFTNRKHPKRAIMGTILGGISLLSLIFVIYLSYVNAGANPGSAGLTGLLITLFSMVGLVLGIMTMMERDRYPLFPVLAIVLNIIALGGISLILYAGASLNY